MTAGNCWNNNKASALPGRPRGEEAMISIGNLSRETTVDDLQHAFERFGQVTSATIIRDKVSGASRGFGFVEMLNKAEADAATGASTARS